MISKDGTHILCEAVGAGCEAKIKNHKWGQIKAENWLFQKNGTAWCPDHHPAWLKAWKERTRNEPE